MTDKDITLSVMFTYSVTSIAHYQFLTAPNTHQNTSDKSASGKTF